MAASSLLESRAQVPFDIIKNYDAELRLVCILKNLYFYKTRTQQSALRNMVQNKTTVNGITFQIDLSIYWY